MLCSINNHICRFFTSAGIFLILISLSFNIYADNTERSFYKQQTLAQASATPASSSSNNNNVQKDGSKTPKPKEVSPGARAKRVIGISLGALLGAAAGVVVLNAVIDCEGMECLLPLTAGIIGGGALGGSMGSKFAQSETDLGLGVYVGMLRQNLSVRNDDDSLGVSGNSGVLIGVTYDWCYTNAQCIGPFFEYNSFSLSEDFYVTSNELGLRYKIAINLEHITLHPGFGISRGRGNISEQGIVEHGNSRADFTSYRIFSGTWVKDIYGEVGLQWYENNRIGDFKVSPNAYVKLGVEF